MSKKVMVINDVAGFGRCSITCCLPILSVMNYETIIVPTAILSSSTAYEGFVFEDYSDKMGQYMKHYDELGIQFDAILTGFLGSEKALSHILSYFETHPNIYRMVDPIMGDNGELYATYTPKLVGAMRELVNYAQLITPNLTELCALCDVPYSDTLEFSEIQAMCESLNIPSIVVSGIERNDKIINYIYTKGEEPMFYEREHRYPSRSGSGDIFSSIVFGEILRGSSLYAAVKRAADFIFDALERTQVLDIEPREGLAFEGLLYTLGEQV